MTPLQISQSRRDLAFFMTPIELRKAIKALWQEMQTMERGSNEWETAQSDLDHMTNQL